MLDAYIAQKPDRETEIQEKKKHTILEREKKKYRVEKRLSALE